MNPAGAPRGAEPLVHREQPPADLLVRGAHVLDPRAGLDARYDVPLTRASSTERS